MFFVWKEGFLVLNVSACSARCVLKEKTLESKNHVFQKKKVTMESRSDIHEIQNLTKPSLATSTCFSRLVIYVIIIFLAVWWVGSHLLVAHLVEILRKPFC